MSYWDTGCLVKLYTPEVLALAAALGGLPSDEGMPFRGSTRSASCGSMVSLGLSLIGFRRFAAQD